MRLYREYPVRTLPYRLSAAVLALALASCGGGEASDQGSTADVAVPAKTLVMSDNAFEPQAWEISEPGTYTVQNQGRGLHNLTIEGSDIDIDVQPGDAQEVEVELDPGEYEMVCKYHIAQGMTGTLVVPEQ